jgi:hypothetical protein
MNIGVSIWQSRTAAKGGKLYKYSNENFSQNKLALARSCFPFDFIGNIQIVSR